MTENMWASWYFRPRRANVARITETLSGGSTNGAMYEESPGRRIVAREAPSLVDHLCKWASRHRGGKANSTRLRVREQLTSPQLDSLGAEVVDESVQPTTETWGHRGRTEPLRMPLICISATLAGGCRLQHLQVEGLQVWLVPSPRDEVTDKVTLRD